MGVHSDRTRVVSGHGSALHYPLHWLPCDLRYEVVVTVLVQERDLLQFGDGAMSRPGKPTALMRMTPHLPNSAGEGSNRRAARPTPHRTAQKRKI